MGELRCSEVMTRQCPPPVWVGAVLPVLIHNLNGAQWDITSLHHWGSSHSAMGGLNNNNIDIDLPALHQLSSSPAMTGNKSCGETFPVKYWLISVSVKIISHYRLEFSSISV